MEDVAIIGVSMTNFGKHPQKTLKDLGMEAALGACKHAGIDPKAIQAAYAGNGLAGIMTGQEGIRGQSVLLGPESPFQGIPCDQRRGRLRDFEHCTPVRHERRCRRHGRKRARSWRREAF